MNGEPYPSWDEKLNRALQSWRDSAAHQARRPMFAETVRVTTAAVIRTSSSPNWKTTPRRIAGHTGCSTHSGNT